MFHSGFWKDMELQPTQFHSPVVASGSPHTEQGWDWWQVLMSTGVCLGWFEWDFLTSLGGWIYNSWNTQVILIPGHPSLFLKFPSILSILWSGFHWKKNEKFWGPGWRRVSSFSSTSGKSTPSCFPYRVLKPHNHLAPILLCQNSVETRDNPRASRA